MRSSLSITLFLAFSLLLASTILASQSGNDGDNYNGRLVKRESALDKLKPIRPVDERKKMQKSNELTTKANKQSRTKGDPRSKSGAKVVDFVKTGKAPASGPQFTSPQSTTEADKAKLSGSTKNEALQSSKVAQTCKTTDNRKPWSQATAEEREAWLSAIKCTYSQPGHFRYKDIVSKSLAEDFGLIHAFLNPSLHHNPSFLPCHRALVLTWLDELRGACGYQGDSLYLDMNTYADAGEMLTTQDLWGTDAMGSLSCPAKGKYVDGLRFQYIGNHGQSAAIYNYEHPLCRSANVKWETEDITFEQHMQSDVISALYEISDYDTFRNEFEMKLHNAFHACIRRDMYASTSPQDAFLFFGFHLFVDCIYWGWQERNGGANRLKYDGMHKGTTDPVSINDQCPMLSLGTNWTVADVMDSREEPGCFTCRSFQPSPF